MEYNNVSTTYVCAKSVTKSGVDSSGILSSVHYVADVPCYGGSKAERRDSQFPEEPEGHV